MSESPMPLVCPEAYKEVGAPILLLAGPGTGKTYQLVMRIKYLVDECEVAPDEITVITFTNEAANGMRNKLKDEGEAEYIEPGKRPKDILTMHSLGLSIINKGAGRVGLVPPVTVVVERILQQGIMRDAAILNDLTEVDGIRALMAKQTASIPSDECTQVIQTYGEILRSCNAVDFDDHISLACDILKQDAELLRECQSSARHLLIDEYQDINADQHRLIRLLAGGQEDGLFAVGDDDQSIYGFRGGDPRFIRTFSEDYPNAKILQLQISRRCLKNILDCAVALVETYDPERSPKAQPEYTQTEPGLVKIWNCPSEPREAELIAKWIYKQTASGEAEDFFILVPNRNYVNPIAQALSALGVPHEIGTAGEENKDWDQLRLIRKWLETPSSILARHVIELILRSGKTSMPSNRVRKEENIQQRRDYARQVAELWQPVLRGELDLDGSLEAAAKTSTEMAELHTVMADISAAYAEKDTVAFVEAVRNGLGIFESVGDLYKCLWRLAGDFEQGPSAMCVTRILTYQSSKGLEADCVFIVALEESVTPSNPGDTGRTAEDARLLFVAMTRAKKELHLHYVRSRTGASTYKAESHNLRRSPFIDCLPTDQCEGQYIAAKAAKAAKAVGKPV